jgi:hypothetical protein
MIFIEKATIEQEKYLDVHKNRVVPSLFEILISPESMQLFKFWQPDPQIINLCLNKATQHNVHFGKKHGAQGLHVDAICTQKQPHNMFYIISPACYWGMPIKQRVVLRSNCNLILSDNFEGSMVCGVSWLEETITKTDYDFYILTNNHEAVCKNKHIKFIYSDAVLAGVVSYHRRSEKPTVDFTVPPTEKVIFPIGHPYPAKLDILAEFYTNSMLDDINWSLCWAGKPYKNHNGGHKHLGTYLYQSNNPVIDAMVKSLELPKVLDNEQDHDTILLPDNFIRKYQWHIAEAFSYSEQFDITIIDEKVVKGFFAGIQTCLIAPDNLLLFLEKLGFQMEPNLIGLSRQQKIAKAIKHCMSTPSNDEKVKHNLELVCDNNFLVDLMINDLVSQLGY